MKVDVSIIMGCRGRIDHVRRALLSYERLQHKSYEILFMDVLSKDTNLKSLYDEFEGRLPIRYVPIVEDMKQYSPETTWTGATTWNYGIRHSEGKFVITCSGDVIISSPDMIDKFLDQYKSDRISVLTYFLSANMTRDFLFADWVNNPDVIQTLPGFWSEVVGGATNSSRLLAGLTTYVTGQPRSMWEHMGLYRTELSHLVCDQDLVLRDVACGRGVGTLDGCIGYHQYHPQGKYVVLSPGWTYQNEMQARLLEPAIRDKA